MLRVTRCRDGGYAAQLLSGVVFIACDGERDRDQARALGAAVRSRPASAVRSLLRDSLPDDSAWCAGKGWWLSDRAPR